MVGFKAPYSHAGPNGSTRSPGAQCSPSSLSSARCRFGGLRHSYTSTAVDGDAVVAQHMEYGLLGNALDALMVRKMGCGHQAPRPAPTWRRRAERVPAERTQLSAPPPPERIESGKEGQCFWAYSDWSTASVVVTTRSTVAGSGTDWPLRRACSSVSRLRFTRRLVSHSRT